ncbi:ABC transporter substrate-binding protein [Rhodococcoides kyotonense]|uniref:Peptide/nickel transport system substrate-binding protein n=1 Tax=Rhodococcoides kyotonense TaxID=398843 RepID=A0A239F7X4_9NOCA|nr:ABC transporter substrate-binding protein [Rhodococcus kyotonensis]SNS52262.1 peptide/nickel transport system substrate-binding protein [Rhodococcus kyotonensis]
MSHRSILGRAAAFATVCALSVACAGIDQRTFDSTALDRDATVIYGQIVVPSSLDPHRGVTENDLPLLTVIYDRITDVDTDGNPIPMLAESWELDDENSSFILNMRAGATFSDGNPVDAAAVKSNIDRILTDPQSTIKAQIAGTIGSVDVLDERTARLNLVGPGGSLPTLLASRPGMLVSPAALGNVDLDQNPVGAGAFMMTSSIPGTEYQFVRRPDYWDDDAYRFRKLTFLIQLDTATRMNSLQAGESTMTGVVGPQKEEAKAGGLQVFTSGGASTSMARISLNTSRSEFGEKAVRQAMNLAIDRAAISRVLYSGDCIPGAQPYPEGYFAHSDSLDDSGWADYDPDRARELLADAGLADGFTFTAAVPSLSIYQNNAQVVQQNLADIGIDMRIEVMDATQARARFVTGEADALVGQYGGGTDPGLYVSSAYLPTGGDNPGKLTTDRMAELYAATARSTDVDERKAAYEDLLAEAFDMGPAQIVLCHSVASVASQGNIGNYEFYKTGGTGLRTLDVSK